MDALGAAAIITSSTTLLTAIAVIVRASKKTTPPVEPRQADISISGEVKTLPPGPANPAEPVAIETTGLGVSHAKSTRRKRRGQPAWLERLFERGRVGPP